MKFLDCEKCQWLHKRILLDRTEFFCTYTKFHKPGYKFGRMINIQKIKKCNRERTNTNFKNE